MFEDCDLKMECVDLLESDQKLKVYETVTRLVDEYLTNNSDEDGNVDMIPLSAFVVKTTYETVMGILHSDNCSFEDESE